MTGLWVLLASVAVAAVFGGYRHLTDGRARRNRRTATLEASVLGHALGNEVTFVQFSSPICAPCRRTAAILGELTDDRPGAAHVELDAAERLDLVSRFGITRTPTVLVLDATGAVRHRFVGPTRRNEIVAVFEQTRQVA